jgi:dihydroxyacetone kinase
VKELVQPHVAQHPDAEEALVVIGGSTHMTLYSGRSLLGEAAVAASDWSPAAEEPPDEDGS